MLNARGIEGTRVLQGLASLAKKHSSEALEKACEIALSYGAYRLRTLRQLLKRQAMPQTSLPFLKSIRSSGRSTITPNRRPGDPSPSGSLLLSEGFTRHGSGVRAAR